MSKSERQKAIAAQRERVARLIDPGDYDALALDIERRQKRPKPGQPGDPALLACARLADTLLGLRTPKRGKSRGELIEYARRLYEDWSGHAIDLARLLEA